MGEALQTFIELTGRTILSPAEYQQALTAGWEDINPRVLKQLVTRAVEKIALDRRPKAKLSWITPDVADGLAAWRRSVGPHA